MYTGKSNPALLVTLLHTYDKMVEEEREILKKKLEHQQHYQTEHAAKVEETKETIATLGKKIEVEDAELTKKGKGFQLKKLRSEARLLVLNSEAAELEKKIEAAKRPLSPKPQGNTKIGRGPWAPFVKSQVCFGIWYACVGVLHCPCPGCVFWLTTPLHYSITTWLLREDKAGEDEGKCKKDGEEE